MEAILISVGGALGAILRYSLSQLIGKSSFPWATLVVNALGSGILGLVVFGISDTELLLIISVGFCGAFTTFSSFSYETVTLWEQGEDIRAIGNAAGNLLLSLLAFGGAWMLIEIL